MHYTFYCIFVSYPDPNMWVICKTKYPYVLTNLMRANVWLIALPYIFLPCMKYLKNIFGLICHAYRGSRPSKATLNSLSSWYPFIVYEECVKITDIARVNTVPMHVINMSHIWQVSLN